MNFSLPPYINFEPDGDDFFLRFGKDYRIPFRVAFRIWVRTRVGEAQNWRCCYCCARVKDSETLEYLVPRSKGGRTTYENCALACVPCNKNRKDRPLEEFLLGSSRVHPINKVEQILSLPSDSFGPMISRYNGDGERSGQGHQLVS